MVNLTSQEYIKKSTYFDNFTLEIKDPRKITKGNFLLYQNGTPSHDILGKLFARINTEVLSFTNPG